MKVARCAALLASLWSTAAAEMVPNPSFEAGDSTAADWTLHGDGEWREIDGSRAIVVRGDGQRTGYWRSAPIDFVPREAYRLRFRARRLDGSGADGTVMSGAAFANRDLGGLEPGWRTFSSYFTAPSGKDDRDWLRFGQWRLPAAVAFDDIQAHRVQLLHRQVATDLVLGEGERIEGGRYIFQAPLRTQLANSSRPLRHHDAGFNTYRWVFGEGQYVLFEHDLGGRWQTAARVQVNVNYHTGGRLLVEAAVDDGEWTQLGQVDAATSVAFDLPAALQPARSVRVRLRADQGRAVGPDADPGSFQVDGYRYEARLPDPAAEFEGATRPVTVLVDHAALGCRVVDPGRVAAGGTDTLVLAIHNPGRQAYAARVRAVVVELGADPAGDWRQLSLPPGDSRVRLPYQLSGAGDFVLHAEVRGDEGALWHAELDARASLLHADGYGERLADADDVVLWWASSGWKVSQTRPPPAVRGKALRIEAARNETEAAQLVLHPRRRLRDWRVTPTDLVGPDDERIPAARVEVLQVGYVAVDVPTDASGEAAPWPDPLLPLSHPVELAAGRNQPLWVRVHVPTGIAAGTYRGRLDMAADGWAAAAPLEVVVFDFDLPERMTCETAFGFSAGNLWLYQGLEADVDRRHVLGLYLDSFRRHHISPYDPAPLDAPRITWPELAGREVGVDEVIEPRVDWRAWDAAMATAIDTLGFTTFRLRVPGMGGGTYIDRRAPELQGYGADTPQYRALFRGYARALERHLAEKGWLDEAFVYWFDEPAPRDYDFVMAGFHRLREAAPGLRRMLTEQVEEELIGGPDLWCPVTPSFDAAAAATRRAAGERFWWYVCTVPKAPYPGLFIDHAATEMRVWLWQTWQRDIDGILVWATNYWTSGAAYPETLQDPYTDPMSWESAYNAPVGARRPWGNGDGRFLYPPLEAARGTEGPVLSGPVESLRWEMLRDGIEDYEYLAMLRSVLASTQLADADRRRYAALLEVPEEITASLTEFTRDPEPIEIRRRALARALEDLGRR